MSASASPRSEIASSSGRLLLAALAALRIDGDVAADEDQPGGRVARRAVLRPGLERPQAGLLERFLRRVEIAEVAQQRRDRLGRAPVRAASIQPRSVTSCQSEIGCRS